MAKRITSGDNTNREDRDMKSMPKRIGRAMLCIVATALVAVVPIRADAGVSGNEYLTTIVQIVPTLEAGAPAIVTFQRAVPAPW